MASNGLRLLCSSRSRRSDPRRRAERPRESRRVDRRRTRQSARRRPVQCVALLGTSEPEYSDGIFEFNADLIVAHPATLLRAARYCAVMTRAGTSWWQPINRVAVVNLGQTARTTHPVELGDPNPRLEEMPFVAARQNRRGYLNGTPG